MSASALKTRSSLNGLAGAPPASEPAIAGGRW